MKYIAIIIYMGFRNFCLPTLATYKSVNVMQFTNRLRNLILFVG
jgi:hypothetical protein